MLRALFIPAAAWLVLSWSVPRAEAACVPKTGRRGTFPHHGDSDIPSNSRFLFEIASWPDKPTVAFKLQYGETDIPGDFHFLESVGPEGQPHSQYLYEFIPSSGIPGTDLPYHYFLDYKLAGSTKMETHSAVFSVKSGEDRTPPEFPGLEDVTYIYGSPDRTTMDSGYDCILDKGTFTIARVKFPFSEVKQINPMETRKDGVVFTAYEASESGTVGKVLARSTIWPAEYTNIPMDWLFVIEKDPAPDKKRCYVVRAKDAVGNEDQNNKVKCVITTGPASLPPGAGSPGFFGNPPNTGACSVSGRNQTQPWGWAALGIAGALALTRRRRG